MTPDHDLIDQPANDDTALLPPLPRADHRRLIDPDDWLTAQSAHAVPLAEAAQAVGALAALVDGDAGMIRRLALAEAEAMLWAQATPLRREEIGRDLMDARASSDPGVLAQARWAIRRLEGQARLDDLRGFLGLHRVDDPLHDDRAAGAVFDETAEAFLRLIWVGDAHPFVAMGIAQMGWRLSGLSPEGNVIEGACFAARLGAGQAIGLSFLPLGHAGRRVWTLGGTAHDRLAALLPAIRQGAEDARSQLSRVNEWAQSALRATARIKGGNPARIIEVLRINPLLTTEMVEQQAGISRDTAERLLARMQKAQLVREVTGTRRFRLWTAAI